MNIDSWLYTKIANSSIVNVYTTRCYPNYAPTTAITPYIMYDSIGYEKNRLMENKIFTIVSYTNSKNNIELINDALYSLFDNSTKYIKESSSNLRIESITIINNNVINYDETNKVWSKVLDVSFWYFK